MNIVKPYVVPGTVQSWIGQDVDEFNIIPRVRNQQTASNRKSCAQHSLCPTIESAHSIEWAKAKDSRVDKGYKADVEWLIENFACPTTPRKLVNEISGSKWKGKIKAEGVDDEGEELFPFEVVRSEVYVVDMDVVGKVERANNFRIVRDHLEMNTPIQGSFYPSKTYNPYLDEVYDTDNTRRTYKCKKSGNQLPVRHAVCVTGTAVIMARGKQRNGFEYLESENPHGCKDGSGTCYMTANSMYSFTIPIIKAFD